MWSKIVQRLNTEITGVPAVRFGDAETPAPPYCVVRKEQDMAGRGLAYRIIGHYPAGSQDDLEDYVRIQVAAALDGYIDTNRHGNLIQLYADADSFNPMIIINDDKTISMERIYWTPDSSRV